MKINLPVIPRLRRAVTRDVNVFLPLFFFLKTCFFSKKHGLKKSGFFLQILLQAGLLIVLIVLCYFLASDSNPISDGS